MEYREFFLEDYRGEHEAPDKTNGAPLYNLEGIYPSDIYTSNDSARNYGDSIPSDNESISIIKSCKNKPNQSVKIYRAVPKIITKESIRLKDLTGLVGYFKKFGFFPVGNQIVHDIDEKYKDLGYDDRQNKILSDIESEINVISSKKSSKMTIEKGNWVTLSKSYAIDHGKSNLNGKYSILSKTVPSKHLYTDGNSINEWGYDPT